MWYVQGLFCMPGQYWSDWCPLPPNLSIAGFMCSLGTVSVSEAVIGSATDPEEDPLQQFLWDCTGQVIFCCENFNCILPSSSKDFIPSSQGNMGPLSSSFPTSATVPRQSLQLVAHLFCCKKEVQKILRNQSKREGEGTFFCAYPLGWRQHWSSTRKKKSTNREGNSNTGKMFEKAAWGAKLVCLLDRL